MIENIVKGKDEEAESQLKEKHVPSIEIMKGKGKQGKDVIEVAVGKETPHPNKVEHHIVWIVLHGVKNNGQVVNFGRMDFAPAYVEPNTRFEVNSIDDFKSFYAVEYCNIHGLWENSVEVQ
ncbi:MAG: desulfoferrodoxin family protein [Methanohalobium sp.]|uniref:desulfoferrodoxin family protein n=1 Tax=Methanohalobium sp. TaxID=2837493 RepID=UPI00397A68F8